MDNSSLEKSEAFDLVQKILVSDIAARAENLKDGSGYLCHYTSSENALNLLNSQQFWLRNARCMNDFSEITNGVELIAETLRADEGTLLNRLLKILGKGDSVQGAAFISGWDEWIREHSANVFIGCLAECSPDETLGKLSMWRAYGSATGGVCFIFDTQPFVAETDLLGAYTLPVCYYKKTQIHQFLAQSISALEANESALSKLTSEELTNLVLGLLVFRAISLKHSGFSEEEEWRVVHLAGTPTSSHIQSSIENVGGIPQIVQKVSLLNDPDNGLHGADIPSLLHRVIVGPSKYPDVVGNALLEKLNSMGVENAQNKIVYSGIPLRM